MYADDTTRLAHMLDFAVEATSISAGRTKEDFLADRISVLAAIRCIEVVGEAASCVSKELQSAHPEIPWAQIVGMRNRLVHGYMDVDLNRLWVTLSISVPNLIERIRPILAST